MLIPTPDLKSEWTFSIELEGETEETEHCTCIIDLSEDKDRADLEPYMENGILNCTFGCEVDGDGAETRKIIGVKKISDWAFNRKFVTMERISMKEFVTALCDSEKFAGFDEDEIRELKRKYGIL